MKFCIICFTLVWFSHAPIVQAQEDFETTARILSEFKSQIEHYRQQADYPSFDPSFQDPVFQKYESGLNLFQNGDGYSAIQTFKGLLESGNTPDSFKKEIHATLGYLFLEQHRPKEALEEFTLIENEPGFKEKAGFGIAWSFIEMEEYVKAISLLEDLASAFPHGEYAQEGLSRIGFCYSKLLAFKSATESYRKALHNYNQMSESQRAFVKKLENPVPFDPVFIFGNSDPEWKRLMDQINEDSNGYQMIHWTSEFFKMEKNLTSRRTGSKQVPPEIRQTLLQTRSKIQTLFNDFIREEAIQYQKVVDNLSVQAAIELAKNLVLEKSELGKESALP